LYDAKDAQSDGQIAKLHFLNDHQKKFLDHHCWNVMFRKDSSLCEGTAIVSRNKDISGVLAVLELRGVDFAEANDAQVVRSFTRPRVP